MILIEKIKEIRTKKHKGNPFGPWVTLKDPPGEAQINFFQTQNVLDIIHVILKEKIKEIWIKKHKGNPFGPWVTLKDPHGEAQMKFFKLKMY